MQSERVQMTDPKTGIQVVQLMSYPTPSIPLMYDWPSVTPDNRRVVFLAQRRAEREAPWDIFRCDTDGLDLRQLTRKEDGAGYPNVTLSLDGKSAYVLWREEKVLRKMDVETGAMEDLVAIGDHCPQGMIVCGVRYGRVGSRLYLDLRDYAAGEGRMIRVDLATGAVSVNDTNMTIAAVDQATGRLIVTKNFMKLGTKITANGNRVFDNVNPEPMRYYSVNEDGSDEQYICDVGMFAHSTILGNTSKIQGPSQPPHRCIWIAEAGTEPYRLVEGPYFWHAGASYDAEWILSDTNWPDQGLQLVHVPSRRFRTLCHAGATQGHAQWGHPHPGLSQDGRIGVFTSDRTGMAQVYVAHITDEFRESVIAGQLDNPRDKWI
ncbi:MAG: Protein TolB [Candidatus Latescibacteria bacterium ADurb.Bin168]|nr:MAG: Protein TolB [Candidatus Latescibacteria bacterium ADurb.Bin168]